DAATGLLSLHAASAGLALARTDAASNAHQLLGLAGVVRQFVQFHRSAPTASPSLFHDFDQMVHFADHALDRRRVFEFDNLVRALQAKAQQRGALDVVTADRAADAANLDLAASGFLLRSR